MTGPMRSLTKMMRTSRWSRMAMAARMQTAQKRSASLPAERSDDAGQGVLRSPSLRWRAAGRLMELRLLKQEMLNSKLTSLAPSFSLNGALTTTECSHVAVEAGGGAADSSPAHLLTGCRHLLSSFTVSLLVISEEFKAPLAYSAFWTAVLHVRLVFWRLASMKYSAGHYCWHIHQGRH